MTSRAPLWLGLGFVAVGLVILVIAAVSGTAGHFGPGVGNPGGQGPMIGGRAGGATMPAPGSPGFVAGTSASPRVVQIVATAQLRFVPDAVPVKQGETVTFEVTTMGPTVHEFMVGQAADVAADTPGTPEIEDIVMMGRAR